MNELRDWRWGDDWLPLHERDPEDDEWIAAEHPEIAARLGIQATRGGANG